MKLLSSFIKPVHWKNILKHRCTSNSVNPNGITALKPRFEWQWKSNPLLVKELIKHRVQRCPNKSWTRSRPQHLTIIRKLSSICYHGRRNGSVRQRTIMSYWPLGSLQLTTTRRPLTYHEIVFVPHVKVPTLRPSETRWIRKTCQQELSQAFPETHRNFMVSLASAWLQFLSEELLNRLIYDKFWSGPACTLLHITHQPTPLVFYVLT